MVLYLLDHVQMPHQSFCAHLLNAAPWQSVTISSIEFPSSALSWDATLSMQRSLLIISNSKKQQLGLLV